MKIILGIYKGAFHEGHDRHSGTAERKVASLAGERNAKRKSHKKGENMERLKNRKGQGLVEYILILVLMGILSIAVVKGLGTTTRTGFSKSTTKLNTEFSNI